jgi:hypothetical protein
VSAPANPYVIEPALLGTRFGAALEGAARDRLHRPQWEERKRAEWMETHPECLSTRPIYSTAADQTPAPVDRETAAVWAKVLSRLSTEFGPLKGQMSEIRKGLLAHRLMDWRVVSGRFQYRRTQSGTDWLEAYRTAYQVNQASEEIST